MPSELLRCPRLASLLLHANLLRLPGGCPSEEFELWAASHARRKLTYHDNPPRRPRLLSACLGRSRRAGRALAEASFSLAPPRRGTSTGGEGRAGAPAADGSDVYRTLTQRLRTSGLGNLNGQGLAFLPGMGSRRATDEMRAAAATRIQALHRGRSSRLSARKPECTQTV